MAKEWKWNEFGKLKNKNDLDAYFKGREYRHGQYCHYTSLYALNQILLNNTIRLSSVNAFNDLIEVEEIENPDRKFVLCFSTGVNENLPMWYIYSGIDGRGCRIRMNKTTIRDLLYNNISFELVEISELNIRKSISVLDEDMYDLRFQDILYYKTEMEEKVSLKYNTMTNYMIGYKEFEKYKNENNGFLKRIAWYYEKETRLMLELKGEILKKMDRKKKYAVEMAIPLEIQKRMSIDLAPEIAVEELMGKKEYEYIKEYIIQSSKVKRSEYHEDVHMGLTEKNLDVFISVLDSILSKKSANEKKEIKKRIRKKIKDV